MRPVPLGAPNHHKRPGDRGSAPKSPPDPGLWKLEGEGPAMSKYSAKIKARPVRRRKTTAPPVRTGTAPAHAPLANNLVYVFVDDQNLFYGIDRKSTRLNSSHGYISYAVFCLKKKKKRHTNK